MHGHRRSASAPRVCWVMRRMWVVAWLSLGGALGCGASTDRDPHRDALFALVTNGETQRQHPCAEVRDGELSAPSGKLEAADQAAVRARIDAAALTDVEQCILAVQAYNECYLQLPCDLLRVDPWPAWLVGSARAPCGCGVAELSPFVSSVLPENLYPCLGMLPVAEREWQVGGKCPD